MEQQLFPLCEPDCPPVCSAVFIYIIPGLTGPQSPLPLKLYLTFGDIPISSPHLLLMALCVGNEH